MLDSFLFRLRHDLTGRKRGALSGKGK